MTVIVYYNKLTQLLQQVDLYDTLVLKCAADIQAFRNWVATDRIYKFLLGLNPEYEEVRSRILSLTPIPSIREVFAMVKQEASRKKLSVTPLNQNNGETTAMAAHKEGKGKIFCDHCNRRGHSRALAGNSTVTLKISRREEKKVEVTL